jgi:hypothetical protein
LTRWVGARIAHAGAWRALWCAVSESGCGALGFGACVVSYSRKYALLYAASKADPNARTTHATHGVGPKPEG